MGRITEHIDYCFMACYEQEGDKIREECPIYKCCYSRQMHEKLSHYEDLEEQGRLIDMDKIDFRCSYPSDCMADTEACKQCDYYVCEFKYIAEAKLKELKEGAE